MRFWRRRYRTYLTAINIKTGLVSLELWRIVCRFLFLLFYVMRCCACPIGDIRPQWMREPKIRIQIKQPPSDNRPNDPPAGAKNEQNVWRTEKKCPTKPMWERSGENEKQKTERKTIPRMREDGEKLKSHKLKHA